MNEIKLPASKIMDIQSTVSCQIETVDTSSSVFDEDFFGKPMRIQGTDYQYIPFGVDDQLPYKILELIGRDEIMSQNMQFNTQTCYASGLQYMDCKTDKPTKEPNIRRFLQRNSFESFFMEQITDVKHFYFTVDTIIVSKDRSEIVQVRHKEACYCRFEKADKNGKINHIFYGDFRNPENSKIECIRLLDMVDPLGELLVLMGKEPGEDGKCRVRTNEFKFAIVSRFPTPGLQYYPVPYYSSIFRGQWYDIKRLISIGKKAKLSNASSIKYHVEVHKDYWEQLCSDEGIYDAEEKKARIEKEYENIRDFLTGIENSGKIWISGFYQNPDGKEVSMVKINVIDTTKEGGDYSDDIQESATILCFAMGIHPVLVGAVPGKSQSNNSGSDKRELFTLKQSIEKCTHDLLLRVQNLIIFYNKWEDLVYPDVPLILLTTLDQKTDAKKISMNNDKVKDPNDD